MQYLTKVGVNFLNEERGKHLQKVVTSSGREVALASQLKPKFSKVKKAHTTRQKLLDVYKTVIKKRGHPDAPKAAKELKARRQSKRDLDSQDTLTQNQRSVYDIQNSIGRQRSRPETPW